MTTQTNNEVEKLEESLNATSKVETLEELEQMKNMSPEERDSFHMRKLEHAEGLMCLYFAAARDKALIRELVRVPYGRGR